MSGLAVEVVDPADEPVLRAVHGVVSRAELLGRDDAPTESFEEMAAMFRHPDSGERAVVLAGRAGEDRSEVVAAAFVWFPLLDNLEKTYLHLVVDPVHQGRGHGRALLAHVLDLVAGEGRTTAVVGAVVPFDDVATHRYRRFGEAAGFTVGNLEVVRRLALPVPDDAITAWLDAAAPHHDCRLATFVDDVPPKLLDSYLVLRGQLAVDAPTGDIDFEEEQITPERFAEIRDSIVAGGRTVHETLAITPDGVVAAHSTIAVPLDGRTDALQWGTFVHREHRGRRLGLAVKAANLRAVQEAHPHLRRITTQNAADNPWMVAVNEQLGFRPVEAYLEMVRRA